MRLAPRLKLKHGLWRLVPAVMRARSPARQTVLMAAMPRIRARSDGGGPAPRRDISAIVGASRSLPSCRWGGEEGCASRRG
jgi:hypothetical protein